MKYYKLDLIQLNGTMGLLLFDDEKDKKPITWQTMVSLTQWDLERKALLIMGLKHLIKKLEERSGENVIKSVYSTTSD